MKSENLVCLNMCVTTAHNGHYFVDGDCGIDPVRVTVNRDVLNLILGREPLGGLLSIFPAIQDAARQCWAMGGAFPHYKFQTDELDYMSIALTSRNIAEFLPLRREQVIG